MIKTGLKDVMASESMYLYLVDELTGEPVRATNWPIKIDMPPDLVPKLMPVMQAMSMYNGAADSADVRISRAKGAKILVKWRASDS